MTKKQTIEGDPSTFRPLFAANNAYVPLRSRPLPLAPRPPGAGFLYRMPTRANFDPIGGPKTHAVTSSTPPCQPSTAAGIGRIGTLIKLVLGGQPTSFASRQPNLSRIFRRAASKLNCLVWTEGRDALRLLPGGLGSILGLHIPQPGPCDRFDRRAFQRRPIFIFQPPCRDVRQSRLACTDLSSVGGRSKKLYRAGGSSSRTTSGMRFNYPPPGDYRRLFSWCVDPTDFFFFPHAQPPRHRGLPARARRPAQGACGRRSSFLGGSRSVRSQLLCPLQPRPTEAVNRWRRALPTAEACPDQAVRNPPRSRGQAPRGRRCGLGVEKAGERASSREKSAAAAVAAAAMQASSSGGRGPKPTSSPFGRFFHGKG